MLSTAADVAQLAQAAPWLAVGALALVASAWVYRQGRRAVAQAVTESARSARAQGERLGKLEQRVGLLDLRRRQTEWELGEYRIDLPYWPPDGKSSGADHSRAAGEPEIFLDEPDDELSPQTVQRRIPVPPLDPAVAARHRRD